MKFEIKHRFTKVTLFSVNTSTLKLAVELAIKSEADLYRANLCGADLRRANLCGVDLREADLDFSCFPLWCGSFGIKADIKLASQLAYHFCRIDFGTSKMVKAAQIALKPLANKFHKVGECGKIE